MRRGSTHCEERKAIMVETMIIETKEVALWAKTNSHAVRQLKKPIKINSSLRSLFFSWCQTVGNCQKRTAPMIKRSRPRIFLLSVMPVFNDAPVQSSNVRPRLGKNFIKRMDIGKMK